MKQGAHTSILGKALSLYVRSWKRQILIYGIIFFVALTIAVVSDFGVAIPLAQVTALIVGVVSVLLFLVPIGYTLAAEKEPDNQMQNFSDKTSYQDIDVLEEKDRRFRETLQPRLTLILSIAALIVSAFAILSNENRGISNLLKSIFEHSELIIIIANLFVSTVAFIFLAKQKTDKFIVRDKEKFKSLAELNEGADIQIYTINLNNRVEKLVNQFRLHMSLFAFSLILIYGVILLTVLTSKERTIGELLLAPPSYEGRTIGYFPIVTNLINLLGALFVQLGFSVLSNKTLEAHKDAAEAQRDSVKIVDDQHSLETTQLIGYNSSLYWAIPLMFFVTYTLIFISLSVTYLGVSNLAVTRFLNIFDLLAGLANGLAMSLLFGRYVSIEQSIGNTRLFKTVFENIFHPFFSIRYKALVSLGIIFILPIYALAQPLFGSLKIDAFGDPNNFQTMVYAICLVGKICFFHLTYILISKKLLHLYLYGLVSQVGNFKELENCFEKMPNKKHIDK